MTWLDVIKSFVLTPAVESYLHSRGAKDESIQALGLRTWQPLPEDAPDPVFRGRYGSRGERLTGRLVCPLRSPRGSLVGFEARSIEEKSVTRYLLPEAAWLPLWLGLVPATMEKIWDGGDVWIVEGLFDMLALEWVLPERDVALGSGRAKLTDKQVEFLRRFCRGRVFLVYDNDPAGKKGMRGWIDESGKRYPGAKHLLDRAGVTSEILPYVGKDPGEVWRAGGVPALQRAFGNIV